MTFKDRGFVLKEIFVGESDKIIIVMLEERGKMSVSARGARKPNSKLAVATQPFCYSEFVIFVGSGFYTISQAEVIHNFHGIVGSYDSFCFGSFFLEMAEKIIYPEMPAATAVKLMISSFKALSAQKLSTKLTASVFQFKFMQMEGYAPEMDECFICGEKYEGESKGEYREGFSRLYFGSGGLVCSQCRTEANPRVGFTEAARYAVTYILSSEIKDLFKFTLADKDLIALYEAATLFRSSHIDAKFKSLELLF